MTPDRPNFEELREERNRRIRAHAHRLAEDLGWDPASLSIGFDFNSCYCTCGEEGGICEHDWSGDQVEIEGGSSATCARCGTTAIGHDLRVMP